jgi:hypothetical protein
VHADSRGDSSAQRRPQFQFGLRSLLSLVTVVALISPLIPGYGEVILTGLLVTLLFVVVPIALGTFALYCRGHRQTYFLGAFTASLGLWMYSGVALRGLDSIVALAIVQVIACAACGYVAVVVRRFIERRGWHVPTDDHRSS